MSSKLMLVYVGYMLGLGLVLSVVTWRQLSEVHISPERIFAFGMTLSVVCSACTLGMVLLSKVTGFWRPVLAKSALFMGMTFGCALLAELSLGHGGFKRIGMVPIIPVIPLVLVLSAPKKLEI